MPLASEAHAVHIQVTFHATGERHAQTLASKLIDSAHEIANLPECECDVDVSVATSPREHMPSREDARMDAPQAPREAAGAVPRGRPPKS